ncbi:MAG: DJ-1/PfpI family protein [Candidatus Aquicultorales bacterium]
MSQLRGMLTGRRIAFLLNEGFDGRRFTELRGCLEGAGAEILIMSSAGESVSDRERSFTLAPALPVSGATVDDFDVLLIGDDDTATSLVSDEAACRLVAEAMRKRMPVVAVGLGPKLLICAGALKGRRSTGAPPIKEELERAGAMYKDKAIVIDDNLITAKGERYVGNLCESLSDLLHGRPPRAA